MNLISYNPVLTDAQSTPYWKGVVAGLGGTSSVTLATGDTLEIITPSDSEGNVLDYITDITASSDVLAALGPSNDADAVSIMGSTTSILPCFGPLASSASAQVFSEQLVYTSPLPSAEVLAFSTYLSGKTSKVGIVYESGQAEDEISMLTDYWGSEKVTQLELSSTDNITTSILSSLLSSTGYVIFAGSTSSTTLVSAAFEMMVPMALNKKKSSLLIPFALQPVLLPLYISARPDGVLVEDRVLFSSGVPPMSSTNFQFIKDAKKAMKSTSYTPSPAHELTALTGYVTGRVLLDALNRFTSSSAASSTTFQEDIFTSQRFLVSDIVMGDYAAECTTEMSAQNFLCSCNHGAHLVVLSSYAQYFKEVTKYKYSYAESSPSVSGGMTVVEYKSRDHKGDSTSKARNIVFYVLLGILFVLVTVVIIAFLLLHGLGWAEDSYDGDSQGTDDGRDREDEAFAPGEVGDPVGGEDEMVSPPLDDSPQEADEDSVAFLYMAAVYHEQAEEEVPRVSRRNSNRSYNANGRGAGGPTAVAAAAAAPQGEPYPHAKNFQRGFERPPPSQPVNGRAILDVYFGPYPPQVKKDRLLDACDKLDVERPPQGDYQLGPYNDLLISLLLAKIGSLLPEGYMETSNSLQATRRVSGAVTPAIYSSLPHQEEETENKESDQRPAPLAAAAESQHSHPSHRGEEDALVTPHGVHPISNSPRTPTPKRTDHNIDDVFTQSSESL